MAKEGHRAICLSLASALGRLDLSWLWIVVDGLGVRGVAGTPVLFLAVFLAMYNKGPLRRTIGLA